MDIIPRTFMFKLFPNKQKEKELDQLLRFWKREVNEKIGEFWKIDIKSHFPPKEYTKGGRLIRDASVKAWQIVKGAKAKGQKIPIFKGNEIDLNEFSAYIIDGLKTKEFDLWFNVISLTKNRRLKLPAKRYERFNQMLLKGQLSKFFKLIKRKNDYFIQAIIKFPKREKINIKAIGIDVGLSNTVATSDGRFYGNELKDLRIKTKWRSYKGRISPFKQGLNHVTRQLIGEYPDCDFAVEKLLFKDKKKRTKSFRRRNNNWAYGHLSNQLTRHGELEGFKVIRVEPAYSSQTCPVCNGFGKRQSNDFTCGICGFSGQADTVGAMNIAARLPQEHPSLHESTFEVQGVG
jgi:IS605 OrfB family transposase